MSEEGRATSGVPIPAGHTYLIGAEGSHLVRIGYAEDVQERLASLQVSQPTTLTSPWSCPGDYERALLQRFAAHRARGEWFDLTTPFGDPVAAVQAAVDEFMRQSGDDELDAEMPGELREAMHTVNRVVHQLALERPLVALRAISSLETLIESEAPAAGVAARKQGATWETIGKAVQATRQAAYQRFGRHLPKS